MSSKRNSSYRTSNVRSKRSLAKMEGTINDQLTSVNVSLRAAYEPIVQLPATIQQLHSEGRAGDVPLVTSLCKSIASDVDTFTKERDKLKDEFQEVVKTRPTDNSGMAEYNMKLTAAGLEYIHLNDRIVATCMKSKTDVEDILKGRVSNAQKESVPQPSQHA